MSRIQEQILDLIRSHVLEVLPDVHASDVTIDANLTDLGANSIDRVEITMLCLDDLNLKLPPSELRGVRDLRGLVDLLARHSAGGISG